MPDNELRRLVDADEVEQKAIRFGRSRFLKLAGGALFAFAASAMIPNTVSAAVAPYPCYGAPSCHVCCGCGGGCRKAYTCGGQSLLVQTRERYYLQMLRLVQERQPLHHVHADRFFASASNGGPIRNTPVRTV